MIACNVSTAVVQTLCLARARFWHRQLSRELKRALKRLITIVAHIWAPIHIQKSILLKTILMLANLLFIQNCHALIAPIDGTRLRGFLGWGMVRIRDGFLVRVTRDQRILIVVENFVGEQVILVHLLLDICHVTDAVEIFFVLNLGCQVLFVHLHRLALLIALLLLNLLVEKTGLLGSHRIVLLLGGGHGSLGTPLLVNLLLKHVLVLVSQARLVLLGHIEALILQVLTRLQIVVRHHLVL